MDTFLVVCGLAAQVALGVWGAYVTLKPPSPSRHKWHLAFFGVVTVAAVAVALTQQYRNSTAQEKLETTLEKINKTGRQVAEDLRRFVPIGTTATKQVSEAGPSQSRSVTSPPPRSPQEAETHRKTPISRAAQRQYLHLATSDELRDGLNDLKKLIVGQRWGLNESALVSLSRRMEPFATERDRGDLITCILGDADGSRFAQTLVAAFRAAGWNLPGSGFNQAVYSGTPEGFIIKLHLKLAKPNGLPELLVSLREAGIEPVEALIRRFRKLSFASLLAENHCEVVHV